MILTFPFKHCEQKFYERIKRKKKKSKKKAQKRKCLVQKKNIENQSY